MWWRLAVTSPGLRPISPGEAGGRLRDRRNDRAAEFLSPSIDEAQWAAQSGGPLSRRRFRGWCAGSSAPTWSRRTCPAEPTPGGSIGSAFLRKRERLGGRFFTGLVIRIDPL